MTEIWGTLGPACADRIALTEMILEGMNGLCFSIPEGEEEKILSWLSLLEEAEKDCETNGVKHIWKLEKRGKNETAMALPEEKQPLAETEKQPCSGVNNEILLRLQAGFLDGVILPSVNSPEEVIKLRSLLKEAEHKEAKIYAGIGTQSGMEQLQEILAEADGILIEREKLAEIMPLWIVPAAEKAVADICRKAGALFGIETGMGAGFMQKGEPSSEEVSDLFQLVCEEAGILLANRETAQGHFPAEAIRCRKRIAAAAEEYRQMQRM